MAVNTVDTVGILPVSNFYLSPDLPHQLHPHRSVGPLTSPLPCWVAISDLTEPKFKPLCSPAPCSSRTHPHSSNARLYPTGRSGQNPSRPFSTSKSYWLFLQILLFSEANRLSPSTCIRPCTHPPPPGGQRDFAKMQVRSLSLSCSELLPSHLEQKPKSLQWLERPPDLLFSLFSLLSSLVIHRVHIGSVLFLKHSCLLLLVPQVASVSLPPLQDVSIPLTPPCPM